MSALDGLSQLSFVRKSQATVILRALASHAGRFTDKSLQQRLVCMVCGNGGMVTCFAQEPFFEFKCYP